MTLSLIKHQFLSRLIFRKIRKSARMFVVHFATIGIKMYIYMYIQSGTRSNHDCARNKQKERRCVYSVLLFYFI